MATVAAASPEAAAPTPRQVELYGQANDAFDDEAYDVAIEALDEALELGSLNVLHLSKGRSLQRLGRCVDARRELMRAREAPVVAEPPPEAVAERVDTYLDELAQTCPGRIVTTCTDHDVRVAVGDMEPVSCAALDRELPPGEVTITATRGDQVSTFDANVVAFETTTVAIALPPAPAPEPARPPAEPATDAPPPPRRGLVHSGQVLTAVGGALLVTAIVLDVAVARRRIDAFDDARASGDPGAEDLQQRARAAQVGAAVTYAIGGATLLAGAIMWGVGARVKKRGTATLVPTPHGAAVSVGGRF